MKRIKYKKAMGVCEAIAKAEDLKIDKDDIKVVPIYSDLCDFESCEAKATHFILMDFRSAGFTSALNGRYCKRHAKVMADYIKKAL